MEIYSIEENILKIVDSELGLSFEEEFNPVKIPFPMLQENLPKKHCLKIIPDEAGSPQEAFIEKEGLRDGQYLSFYPSGNIKQETYYRKNQLHGPSTVYSLNGIVLSQCWFIHGKREGKCRWYYSSGELYCVQNFVNGVWNATQTYYYPDGKIKSLLHYHKGILKLPAQLYDRQGMLKNR